VKTLAITYLSIALTLPASAALVAPAMAYASSHSVAEFRPNPGSRPTPGPAEIRGSRFYPVSSQLGNEQGSVGLKIALADDGTMKDAAIENSSGSARLDAAALQYAREQYQYKVGDGEQMPDLVRVTVTFNLN
jgi:TonB family protein